MEKIFSQPNLIFIVGSSRSGKSYLIKYLLQSALKNIILGFKFGIVFTMSKFDTFDKSSYTYLPNKYVLPYYSNEVLGGYLKQLEKQATRTGKPIPINFIVFDDVIGSIKNSDIFKHFISTYRKYNTTIIIASQYAAAISTLAREQISFAFIFKQNSKPALKHIYEAIGLEFDSEHDFKEALNECTKKKKKEKYNCMMYVADAENIEDKYMTFKAPKHVSNIKFVY